MDRVWKVLRIVGVGLAAVVVLALLGLFAASQRANSLLQRKVVAHRVDFAVSTALSAAELERAALRGKHLVEARYGCNVCHGANLAGGVMLDEPAIGQLRGPNLTRGKGGLPSSYSVADWDRAVRHGIKRDGTPSLMPAQDAFAMSDQELADIVAYVRSLPAVDARVPTSSLGPVGKVLLALGKLPLAADALPDHHKAHAKAAPEATDSAEFGAHLATTCTGCHRDNLAGGPMPFGPPGWPAAATAGSPMPCRSATSSFATSAPSLRPSATCCGGGVIALFSCAANADSGGTSAGSAVKSWTMMRSGRASFAPS